MATAYLPDSKDGATSSSETGEEKFHQRLDAKSPGRKKKFSPIPSMIRETRSFLRNIPTPPYLDSIPEPTISLRQIFRKGRKSK
jgi:hypothetical protein